MAYDEQLAARVRDLAAGEEGLSEQRMFGGLAFLIHRNMAVAASSDGGLLVRVDPDEAVEWTDGEQVTPMVMRGKEMSGWLRVAEPAAHEQVDLWVERGVSYARSLPAKT